MKKRIYYYLLSGCITLILILFLMYNHFVSVRIYEESTSHLQEIYTQVNRTFSSLVSRNWNLLSDWSSYIGYVTSNENEDDLPQYLQAGQEKWNYTDFYFLSSDGNYMTLEGDEGYLDFGQQLSSLMVDREDVVIDGTLPGGEALTIFAVPVTENTYHDFVYSAIAISYNNDDLEEVLNVSAFSGEADCFIVYPDGRILFSATPQEEEIYNYFSYLAENARLASDDLSEMLDNIENNTSGILQYRLNDTEYYLVYQPVGFQDWTMLGIVEKNLVNANMNQVQYGTIIMLSVVFVMIAALIFILILNRNRRQLYDKDVELKYREQLFGMLADNTDDIFIMFSLGNFQAEYVSPNIERILGISAETIRNDICALADSAISTTEKGYSMDHLTELPLGNALQAERERIHQQTGTRKWYQEILYRVKIDNTDKFILILADRTKEKKSRTQLEQALDIAKSANEAKSSFLSNMSHDIRTPLNAIIGFLTLIDRDADKPDKVHAYVKKISVSSQYLLNLINDILDMSKIESGKTSLHIETFCLSDMLDSIYTVIKPQTKAKKQKFSIEKKNFTEDYVQGDRLRINQILMNLLSNSVKYTQEHGQIHLTVSTLPSKKRRGTCKIIFTVEDNGIGMSPEFQKIIFDSFTREYNSTTSKIQGTGLGMTITKSLVDLMGGTISVESTPGKGSRFTVKLTLRTGKDTADTTVSDHAAPSTSSDILHGLHFLVAEDNEVNAEILKELLDMEGAKCDIAENGQEAVDLFLNSAPGYYDGILMDVQMPVMDGYEAVRTIRSSGHPDALSIPIAAMTANTFAEDVQNSLRAGMNAHIAKPINMDRLKAFAEEYIRPYRKKQQI